MRSTGKTKNGHYCTELETQIWRNLLWLTVSK